MTSGVPAETRRGDTAVMTGTDAHAENIMLYTDEAVFEQELKPVVLQLGTDGSR
jgi:hypothetical protein